MSGELMTESLEFFTDDINKNLEGPRAQTSKVFNVVIFDMPIGFLAPIHLAYLLPLIYSLIVLT